jgi:hypothetical protein
LLDQGRNKGRERENERSGRVFKGTLANNFFHGVSSPLVYGQNPKF